MGHNLIQFNDMFINLSGRQRDSSKVYCVAMMMIVMMTIVLLALVPPSSECKINVFGWAACRASSHCDARMIVIRLAAPLQDRGECGWGKNSHGRMEKFQIRKKYAMQNA